MFIKVKTIGDGGKLNILVKVDSIISVLESKTGCQILLPGGDFVQVVEKFEDVEGRIKKAYGGTGHTIFV